MTTGEKIRIARKNAKLTQTQLADELGVSQAMIGQYENGVRNPKYETLDRIARVLDVKISELLPDTDYNRILGEKAEKAYMAILEQIVGLKGYTFGITEDDDTLYIKYPEGILKLYDDSIPDRLQDEIESYVEFKMQELKNKHINSFVYNDNFDFATRKTKNNTSE